MKFKVGDKVSYSLSFKTDKHKMKRMNSQKIEHGIIKSIEEDKIYVVFNCENDWKNYQNYTASLCNKLHLFIGWI